MLVTARRSEARGWRLLGSVAGAVLLTHGLFLLVGYLAHWFLNTDRVTPSFVLDDWYRWDTFHYLAIAEHGYSHEIINGHAPAFFPLFPLVIRAVSGLGPSPLLAGMLVSLVSSVVACFYLHKLARLHGYDGHSAVLYLLLFPTGVFLTGAYTEALFLAGAIPAFYYAYRGRPWLVVPFAAVAVGTRTVGLFVLAAVAIELVRSCWPERRRLLASAMAIGLASLPFWAYGFFLQRTWGDFFAFQKAQKDGWGREFAGFGEGFVATWNSWDAGTGANLALASRLEIVFGLLSVLLLGWLLWRRYWGYAFYVGATLVIALGNAWYYSNPRLALGFFPFAFAISAFVGGRPVRHTNVVMVLAGLACLGTVVFTQGAWFF